MRFRQQLESNFDVDKRSLIRDYRMVNDGKKPHYSDKYNILQRQNEKLMAENLSLRKQNEYLLKFKEKYTIDKKSNQFSTILLGDKRNSGINSFNKPIQFKDQYCPQSHRGKYQPAKSARNYNEISSRIQHRVFQTQQRLKSRNSSISRGRKRFNYLGLEQAPQKTKQNKPTAKEKEQNDTERYFQNIELKEEDKTQQKQKVLLDQSQKDNITSVLWLDQQGKSTKSNEILTLKSQIEELRQIQSKLLDKIQERDSIIEKLHYLLTAKKEKEKSIQQTKDLDSETIDSAFSPKIQP